MLFVRSVHPQKIIDETSMVGEYLFGSKIEAIVKSIIYYSVSPSLRMHGGEEKVGNASATDASVPSVPHFDSTEIMKLTSLTNSTSYSVQSSIGKEWSGSMSLMRRGTTVNTLNHTITIDTFTVSDYLSAILSSTQMAKLHESTKKNDEQRSPASPHSASRLLQFEDDEDEDYRQENNEGKEESYSYPHALTQLAREEDDHEHDEEYLAFLDFYKITPEQYLARRKALDWVQDVASRPPGKSLASSTQTGDLPRVSESEAPKSLVFSQFPRMLELVRFITVTIIRTIICRKNPTSCWFFARLIVSTFFLTMPFFFSTILNPYTDRNCSQAQQYQVLDSWRHAERACGEDYQVQNGPFCSSFASFAPLWILWSYPSLRSTYFPLWAFVKSRTRSSSRQPCSSFRSKTCMLCA